MIFNIPKILNSYGEVVRIRKFKATTVIYLKSLPICLLHINLKGMNTLKGFRFISLNFNLSKW